MRGSLKVGKLQYRAVNSGTKEKMVKEAVAWEKAGNKYLVRKGRGVFYNKYILYVLPKKPKGVR